MKFSTWLEEKKMRTVPVRKQSNGKIRLTGSESFAGAPGPECEKCGKKTSWVPEPKFKKAWWGSKSGDRGPAWLNKGHWRCNSCGKIKVPGVKK